MSDDAALKIRVADLRAQVKAAEGTATRLSRIDEALYRRVAGRLEELTASCTETLDEAEAAVADGDETEAWGKLRRARKLTTSLCAESLAFTEGALLRRERLDDGFCEVADKLLDHVNERGRLNWRGFTIVAETSFYGDVGEVIRLKFPETSIWHLPVACHEFGHFANPSIRVEVRDGSYWGWKHPVEALLEERWKGSLKSWFYAHEHLADIFAVYSIGPAYAYAAVILRAEPGALRTEYPTHPSWDDRYFLIVETLRRVSAHGGATQAIVDDVERRWESSRGMGGASKEPDVEKLGELLKWFYPLLNEHLRGVRYASFGRAQQLVPALVGDDRRPPSLQGASIPDILNAAWLARLEKLDNVERTAKIAENALAACQEL